MPLFIAYGQLKKTIAVAWANSGHCRQLFLGLADLCATQCNLCLRSTAACTFGLLYAIYWLCSRECILFTDPLGVCSVVTVLTQNPPSLRTPLKANPPFAKHFIFHFYGVPFSIFLIPLHVYFLPLKCLSRNFSRALLSSLSLPSVSSHSPFPERPRTPTFLSVLSLPLSWASSHSLFPECPLTPFFLSVLSLPFSWVSSHSLFPERPFTPSSLSVLALPLSWVSYHSTFPCH